MSSKLDIDALQTLKAVADLGGITRAADFLALSQSAVSHKIRRLEQSIECRLLQRKAGAPLLTKAGEGLLNYAERIIALHNEALASLGSKHLTGQIRIGTTEDITSSTLANILGRFARMYPAVTIYTQVEQNLELETQLQRGDIDIAIMQLFAKQVRESDLVYLRDSLVWVSALDYIVDSNESLPFIAFDQNCFYRQWAYQQVNKKRIKLHTVLQCPSINGVCNAVESGLGIALVSQQNVRSSMKRLNLNLPPPDVAYVIRSRNQQASKIEQGLINQILREVSH